MNDIYRYVYILTNSWRRSSTRSKHLRYYFRASFWRESRFEFEPADHPFTLVASLSKCDNLFSEPRNRCSRPSTRPHPSRTGGGGFPSPAQCRVIVRLTPLTLCHHYDVNERQVSILDGLGWPVRYFPRSVISSRSFVDSIRDRPWYVSHLLFPTHIYIFIAIRVKRIRAER